MLNNLPIGIYLAGTSPVHRLRARTKLLLLIWLAGSFFIANHKMFHYGVYAVAFATIVLALIMARVDIGYIWRRMRVLVILLAISIPFSLMWTPGETWHTFGPLVLHFYHVHIGIGPLQYFISQLDLPIGPIVVTYDGIWFTISYTAIFLLLYLGSITLTLTTTPVALAEGVVLLLRPFRWLRIPAEEFGLMTLVSLRFVPVLVQETEQLIKAQISRGADFTTGSLSTRVRRLGTLLVPLVQGALRRADGLSSALEARGYGVTGTATLLHEGPLRLLDWLILIGVPTLIILAFWTL
ncbi:MAG: energy-coupling factor transporter transmembrane component T family protein [Ktedonobacterales bacterium]